MGMNSCNRHPSAPAVARCQQCSKPACAECVVNQRFCSEECNARFGTFMKNYKKPADLNRSAIPAILVFLVVVAGLYFGLKRYGYLPW
jgi:hypothetical protein